MSCAISRTCSSIFALAPMTRFRADDLRNVKTSRRGRRRPRKVASGAADHCRGRPLDSARLTSSAMNSSLRRLSWCLLGVAAMGLSPPPTALAQPGAAPGLSLELVDPKVLRVCADPNNMPFSTEKGEGFENKLAEMLAEKLGKRLSYTWYPQATGFVRNTLAAHKCDVMMGAPQGDDLVQVTNPYYRTAYALVFKQR